MPRQPPDLEAISGVLYAGEQRPDSPTTRTRAALAGVALLMGVIGFSIGTVVSDDSDPVANAATTTSIPSSSPIEVSSASLVLGQGDASGEWTFVAQDPATRAFSVSVDDLSPPDADIVFVVRVSDGRTLNVGRTTDDQSCDGGTVNHVCKFELGGLQAERPGTWVLRLEKNSRANARVATTIRFVPAGFPK